jgi:biotin synthesis protein BioG
MGVWVAGHLLAGQEHRLVDALAVNGTLTPIDDRCGIPERAYGEMIAAFSPETLLAFCRSMFSEQTDQDRFLAHRPRRAEAEIREELVALRDQFRALGPAPDLYRRCLVGSRDRVFTARAQVRSWGRDRCRQVPAPHFPFYGLGWDHLLAGAEGI